MQVPVLDRGLNLKVLIKFASLKVPSTGALAFLSSLIWHPQMGVSANRILLKVARDQETPM